MSIRILSSTSMVGPALEQLGQRFPDLCLAPYRSSRWYDALPEAQAILVLLSESIHEEDLHRATKLRVLGTYSAGVNHLPVEACRERGIALARTPGVLTEATADMALSLLLAATRRIREGEELVRSGRWTGWAPELLLGIGLEGKTCGILGSGPIGQAFARRVASMNMHPVFWDRDGQGIPVDLGFLQAPRWPLEKLLSQSQVLSLHCPLTLQTQGLLSRDRLKLLPQGAVLINTARGGILDELALIELLEAGHIGAVGLDVYDNEPKLNPRWLKAPRTVLLPHLGSATRETREAMAHMVCDGVAKVLESVI